MGVEDTEPEKERATAQPGSRRLIGSARKFAWLVVGAVIGAFAAVFVAAFVDSDDIQAWWGRLSGSSPPPTGDPLSPLEGVAPAPGDADDRLGWGGQDGSREAMPYTERADVGSEIRFNSFVDVPSLEGVGGDERAFVVLKTSRGDATTHPPPEVSSWDHRQRADPGELVWVRVYVHNNANPQADCSVLSGSTIATNTRLRMGAWSSATGRDHVIRAWITSDNASWVTAAAHLNTPVPARLEYVSGLATQWMAEPRLDDRDSDLQPLQPGGTLIGDAGRLGGCWENRAWLIIPFRVAPAALG